MKGCIQMWYTATGWNGVHFLPREHALLCSEFVTRTVLLNTPAVLATAEQSLHNIKAFLFVTLGVGKGLGGNRVGTADTNQLKGYPILCIFMLRDKNLGVGGGTSSSIATAQNPLCERWREQNLPLTLLPSLLKCLTLTQAFSCLYSSCCIPHPTAGGVNKQLCGCLTVESAHTRICKTCVSTA